MSYTMPSKYHQSIVLFVDPFSLTLEHIMEVFHVGKEAPEHMLELLSVFKQNHITHKLLT